ncbi:MAG: protein kinase [Gemmatimonadaceae bacterium]
MRVSRPLAAVPMLGAMDLLEQVKSALGERYVVDREVGRGGMAVVFLAHDRKHHRRVAIKVLRTEVAHHIGADRFVREIEIAANITHPHVLPLYDSGQAGDIVYYVMPYVEGETLRHHLDREKQLGLDESLHIASEVADAVGYAHGLGIVHRDLKPENVLLEAGHAVVSDFGIARAITAAGGSSLTETGIALGTPAYMSPEQATGDGPVDARSDVYALGCLLYELLAGQPPFTGATAQAILARKLVGDYPPLSVVRDAVPENVQRAIHRALARVPADRFATAKDFADSLRAAAPHRTAHSRRWPVWLAGAAALAIVGFSVGLWLWRDTPPPRTLAVLYFDNLSTDTVDAYLADGLTEEISSRLAGIGRLQVKSRSAVRHFRGTSVSDPFGAARELGVRYLVEGSVRRAGERVRTSVQLVDAQTGFRVWGESYDRASHDMLSLQEHIAREVAIQISGRLLPAEEVALATRPTEHPQAYDHFLRGNYYLTQRTPAAVGRAITEFETAVRLDSSFTDALARAAYAYALYVDWGWVHPGLPPDSLLARGFAAAERALARDSTAADAWMGRAYMLAQRYPRTLDGSREAFERALSLDRDNAEAWHQYGWLLYYLGGADSSAVAAFHEALRIEPQRPFTLLSIAAVDFYARRPAAAVRWLDSALVIDPSFGFAYAFSALAKLQAGDGAGARADAEAAQRHSDPVYAETALAVVQARLGDTAGARARIAGLTTIALRRETLPVEEGVFLAAALAATGDRDRALRVLERVRPRGAHLFNDLQSADLDPLRTDPRFQRLVDESRPPGR